MSHNIIIPLQGALPCIGCMPVRWWSARHPTSGTAMQHSGTRSVVGEKRVRFMGHMHVKQSCLCWNLTHVLVLETQAVCRSQG